MPLRFYQAPHHWEEDSITGDESRHAVKVLRVKPGERIEVFDGGGRVALCEVTDIQGKTLDFVRLSERVYAPVSPRITLYQSIPKGKNMDLIIQKAVELGVSRIQPIITQNTVAVADDGIKKAEKWQRIALEASKQCKQVFLPRVEAPIRIDEIGPIDDDLKLVASLRDNAEPMRKVLLSHPTAQSISIIIGPEGDFTESEVEALEISGFLPVSMGELVLRVETATLFGISALRFHYLGSSLQ